MNQRLGSTPLRQLIAVVVLSLLAPLGLGLALDGLLGSAPLALFVCSVIGILAGTVGVVRIMTRQFGFLAVPAPPAENSVKAANGKEDRA